MRNRKEILKNKVDAVVGCRGGGEGAHSMEDGLLWQAVEEFCPTWVTVEMNRLRKTKFGGWCA